MFKIWAILSLLIGLVVLAGIAWLVLYLVGKAVFEDLFAKIFKKLKRKKDKDDQYIY